MLRHYKGSIDAALTDLYPSITLNRPASITSIIIINDIPLCNNNANDYYEEPKVYIDVNNRKELFHIFARQGKFDPLVAENWYSVTKKDILSIKVIL